MKSAGDPPTYQRYKAALEAIADGADDPAAIAIEALRNRSVGLYPDAAKNRVAVAARKARAGQRRNDRLAVAGQLYNDWIAAGTPGMTAFARQIGWTRRPAKLHDLMQRVERKLKLHYRKRLADYYSRQSGRYVTFDEHWAQEYPGEEVPD